MKTVRTGGFTLRNARIAIDGGQVVRDLSICGSTVVDSAPPGSPTIDLQGRALLAGIVNAHDHLDFSTFQPLGHPPYASLYEWAADVKGGAGDPDSEAALRVPLVDRLFLGGLRNLLAGVTAVAHHGPGHRSLWQAGFPVRVLRRYDFAHSPGLTPNLARTVRHAGDHVPWMIHAGEGTDERCQQEIPALARAGLLRSNSVLVHAIACGAKEAASIAAARARVVWCPESNRHLYGVTAPARMFRDAGIRLGLGSDSPVSGVRDALTNLAVARLEGAFEDGELLRLATSGSAEAVGLPVGGFHPGDSADFLVTDSIDRLLRGDRGAVDLVVMAGRPLYGEPSLMHALPGDCITVVIDGEQKRLVDNLGRKAASLLAAHNALADVTWIRGLRFP